MRSQFRLHVPFLFAVLLAGGLSAPARAAIFTVGGDAACTHSNVLLAILAASGNGPGLDEIRIATNQTYTGVIGPVSSHSVHLRGGFASCSASTPSGRTLLSGTGDSNSTISTSGTAAAYVLVVEDIALVNALGGIGRRGGALRVEGDFAVELRNVAVSGNRAGRGGGVFIDGSNGAALVLTGGTLIINNTASISGGGIYCRQGGQIIGIGGGSLLQNVAENGGADPAESGNGGGAALYGCRMSLTALGGPLDGVVLNRAARDGGGFYLRNDAQLDLRGNADTPVRVIDNQAGGGGGGIAVRDALPVSAANRSRVNIFNSWVESNRAPNGAGLGLLAGGELLMQRTLAESACHSSKYCSSLSLNDKPISESVCFGAAVFAGEGARVRIHNTFVEENCPSDNGWAFHQRLDSELRIDSSVIARSGGSQPFFIDGGGATSAGVVGFSGLQQIAWSTVSGHYESVSGGMFSLPSMSSSTGTLRVYGSLLGETFLQLTQVGGPGMPPPMTLDFDCLLLDSVFAGDSFAVRAFETGSPYGMLSPLTGDYAPANGSAAMVDLCDSSRGARANGDILGRTALSDAPRSNIFGIHDAGAYEFQVAAGPIFANGFEAP